MQFFKNATLFALISTIAGLVQASPVEVRDIDQAEDSSAVVNMYAGDTCNGQSSEFTVVGRGGYRCVPVPFAVRSIAVGGAGCTITAWSGWNCEGSSFRFSDNSCHSVLYASVSVNC